MPKMPSSLYTDVLIFYRFGRMRPFLTLERNLLNELEEEAKEDVDEDDEEETENEDEEVGRKGFKAKVMEEIKALRKNVTDLETRLKLMEERVSAPCGVSNNAAEVDGNEVDANAMQMDDHDDPTHTEECGPTAVVDDANNVKESDVTTPSVEIISTILNELADVVENSKDERECDPTTASNPIISPALLDVAAAELTNPAPCDETCPIKTPANQNIYMDVLLKRPRYPSKYRVSPYTEPRASKRAKHIIEPSLEIHPIFIAETVEEWNELKDWIEGDESQPPLNVVLMIPDEFEVNRGFFQDLVTCNLWLASYVSSSTPFFKHAIKKFMI
ncbi:unnamed protein product [Cuscuta europaea]|uniref:Uncharacterized protein n=1 Tax=Cuscuta europaea TaxID=41803 RepID=A0A9P1E7I2_CUSEU|nr:unnamed protein product [Cuscuta europaea]